MYEKIRCHNLIKLITKEYLQIQENITLFTRNLQNIQAYIVYPSYQKCPAMNAWLSQILITFGLDEITSQKFIKVSFAIIEELYDK